MGENGEELTLDEYREMTPTQNQNVTKNRLIGLIDAAIDNEPNFGNNANNKLDLILNKLQSMEKKNESYDNEIKRIDNTVNEHSNILSVQQKFLEDLDADRRAQHLIVLGLKEDHRGTDREKFLDVVETIGVEPYSVKIESMVRLGTRDKNELQKTRPMKVTFETSNMRDSVLRNAVKLKDQPEESHYRKIYLKKDMHPKVREEEKRLYEVWKAEKNKAVNAGKEVLFDRKRRVVTCNGEEVDRFQLFSSPFQ